MTYLNNITNTISRGLHWTNTSMEKIPLVGRVYTVVRDNIAQPLVNVSRSLWNSSMRVANYAVSYLQKTGNFVGSNIRKHPIITVAIGTGIILVLTRKVWPKDPGTGLKGRQPNQPYTNLPKPENPSDQGATPPVPPVPPVKEGKTEEK